MFVSAFRIPSEAVLPFKGVSQVEQKVGSLPPLTISFCLIFRREFGHPSAIATQSLSDEQ